MENNTNNFKRYKKELSSDHDAVELNSEDISNLVNSDFISNDRVSPALNLKKTIQTQLNINLNNSTLEFTVEKATQTPYIGK